MENTFGDVAQSRFSSDASGAKAQMGVFFDASEMQAKGTPFVKLNKIIEPI